MGDKFTIRDFFTYLLGGCCVYLCFLIIEFSIVKEFVKAHKELIKDNSTLIIFISLPILYFTGQFLQSLDMLLYFFGAWIRKLIDNPKINRKSVLKFIYFIFCKHRITGNLVKKNIESKAFWKKCNALELASKYSHAEYSYILNDLFKGLLILNVICCVYTIVKGQYNLTFIFVIVAWLSWLRAIHYANIFVDTINSTYEVIIENREFDKKTKESAGK